MRSLSSAAQVSLMERVTDELWLVLLTIDIDGTEYRVVGGSHQDVTSNGDVYTPYAFDVLLPAESLETVEQVTLTLDNVDQILVDGLRAAKNPLQFKLQLALYSQPDTIELELDHLESQSVEFDEFQIRATLILNDIWNQKFPGVGEKYDAIQYPRLF